MEVKELVSEDKKKKYKKKNKSLSDTIGSIIVSKDQ